jgi:hypothetical protein
MKQKIYRILNVAFYPFMLVMAFNCYAFQHHGFLIYYMVMMTFTAMIFEFGYHREIRKVEALKFACELLAQDPTEIIRERDQLKLQCISLCEELAELKEDAQ